MGAPYLSVLPFMVNKVTYKVITALSYIVYNDTITAAQPRRSCFDLIHLFRYWFVYQQDHSKSYG